MSKWITEISLNNYRAFGSTETIRIPKGSHMLIYGENGSGKSSIYTALKDFFASSNAEPEINFKLNYFEKIRLNETGSVTIKIEEDGQIPRDYVFTKPEDQSTHRQGEIILANKFKGFLDYRKMLKIHAFDFPDGNAPNFFDLIARELLKEHRLPDPKGGVGTVEFLQEYDRIAAVLKVTRSAYREKTQGEIDQRLLEIEEEIEEITEENSHLIDIPESNVTRRFDLDNEKEELEDAHKILEAKDHLQRLDQEFVLLLTRIENVTNDYLHLYFKNKIQLRILYSRLSYNARTNEMAESISLQIHYANNEIEFYQAFLNEARLSALAISIYLASIKTFSPGQDALKVLFLDDVFIGLDTGNRIPLLNILKDEFIDDGYQLFISTYDRQWFEMARTWMQNEKCQVKCLELFVNDSDGNPATPDIPVIIDPSICAYDKAQYHFAHKDYPAAANYLRRSCEAEIKRILPSNMKLKVDNQTGEIKKIEILDNLIDKLISFMTENNLDQTPFRHFKTYKKILFNPLSHDDLDSAHYRQEIVDGINLVAELQKIRTKVIIETKESHANPMKFRIQDNRTQQYHDYELIVLENLQIIQVDVNPIALSKVECQVKEADSHSFHSLSQAFDRIWTERGYHAPTNYTEFYNRIEISQTEHLIDLMTF